MSLRINFKPVLPLLALASALLALTLDAATERAAARPVQLSLKLTF